MLIGVLKEIKPQETRVSLTPAGVDQLVACGHRVCVEPGAGMASGFTDEDYCHQGAELLGATEIFARADLLLHVKEPQPNEYPLLRPGQILFTYFHFAASRDLTRAMLNSGAVCIAYETIQDGAGRLPLLTPMSEVAGRMAAQEAAKYLERSQGGRGILLGGVSGVSPATIMVLGAGTVGTEAARMACGLGAQVYLLDRNLNRIRELNQSMPANCTLLYSSPMQVRELLPQADAVIGAVLLPGAQAPRLIQRKDLAQMKKGAVLIDVAIDQGGCFETSRPTSHQQPTFEVDGVIHYCVANMPGAVPLTSTLALTNATLPYVIELANHGWRQLATNNAEICSGINIACGELTCAAVAQAFDLSWMPVVEVLKKPQRGCC